MVVDADTDAAFQAFLDSNADAKAAYNARMQAEDEQIVGQAQQIVGQAQQIADQAQEIDANRCMLASWIRWKVESLLMHTRYSKYVPSNTGHRVIILSEP